MCIENREEPGTSESTADSCGCRSESARFDAIVREHRPALLKLAHALHAGQEAEDLVQETLCRAWRAWPTFRRDRSFYVWARQILINVYRDTLRRAVPVALWSLDAMPHDRTAAESDVAAEALSSVYAEELLSALPPLARYISRMTAMGWTDAEIAREIGISPKTVRTRRFRARQAMRSAR